jgi:hypothetical protein
LQSLESSGTSTTTAYADGCRRLILEIGTSGEKHTLLQAQSLPGRLSPIYRTTYNHGVALRHLLYHLIADIVIESASVVTITAAGSTSYASTDSLIADPNDFTVHPMLSELLGYLVKSGVGITLFTRAAIYK